MKTTAFLRLAAVFALLTTLDACSSTPERGDSESHFLFDCYGGCKAGLECICGVCTRACSAASACTDLSAKVDCAETMVGCPAAGSTCDVACFTSGACDTLGAGFDCVGGRCRRVAPPVGASDNGLAGEGPTASSARRKHNLEDPGSSLPAIDAQAACAVQNGHLLSLKNPSELDKVIVGDWLECGVAGRYPSNLGDGIRFHADRTWYSLIKNGACGYDPLNTGFDGYGTWTVETWSISDSEIAMGVSLYSVGPVVTSITPAFTDTGQFSFGEGGPGVVYVRMPTTPATDPSCGVPDPGPSDAGGQPAP